MRQCTGNGKDPDQINTFLFLLLTFTLKFTFFITFRNVLEGRNMARNGIANNKFKNYMQISEAAEYLGVSSATLRNWDRAGKLAAYRHPINGYRLYRREDLAKLLEGIQNS
jgi:DNA (cytosine-5)-methyltransferase 1